MFRTSENGDLELEAQASSELGKTIRRHDRVFEALLCRSRDGILLATPEMNLLRLVHPLMGHKIPDLVGRPMLSFIHPDDAAGVSAAFSQVISGQKQTVFCEGRNLNSDGKWCWLEMQITDLLDDPDIAAVLFNYRDITQRKMFEEMRECLAAYRACPEYSMFTLDADGVILDWNPGAEVAFGYSSEEMVGRNISLLIPPKLLDQEVLMRAEAVPGRDVPEYATSRIRRDGQEVSVLVKLSAVSGGHSRAIVEISRLIKTL